MLACLREDNMSNICWRFQSFWEFDLFGCNPVKFPLFDASRKPYHYPS